MKGKIGIWLDHRRAVILAVSNDGEEVKNLASGILRHPRSGGKTTLDASQQDAIDRQFRQQTEKFFADILPYLKDGESIQIFGPGEAKKELEAFLRKQGLKDCIIEVTTLDKMTDRQLIAAMRKGISS